MSTISILNAGSLPNIPWQEKPKDMKTAAPVWRYSGNPILGRNPTPEIARIFNSAVAPWEDGFIAVLRGLRTGGDRLNTERFIRAEKRAICLTQEGRQTFVQFLRAV